MENNLLYGPTKSSLNALWKQTGKSLRFLGTAVTSTKTG